ncbi:MAG: chloride channel protein [Eggerthellaceae bacterium]|nr:chloride channel protein [Eggerthellaceae bacterium]
MTARPHNGFPRRNAGGKERSKDTRPFIVNDRRLREDPGDLLVASIGMVALALAVGFAVGLAVFALMNGSTWLTGLLWHGLGDAVGVSWFPLAICTIGGAVIGVWTWWSNDRVRPLEEVLGEFRKTGSYRTQGALKPVVTFLLPLVFGGSIGFEAGLTGLITAGCCWIRDKLKAAGLRWAAVADVTIAASFAAIFGTPLAGIVAGAESSPDNDSDLLQEPGINRHHAPSSAKAATTNDNGTRQTMEEPNVDEYNMRRGVKIVLYTAAAFGAFGGIALFSWMFGTTGGLPRFEAITATRAQLLWTLPCLVVAYVMALFYHGSNRLFGGISAQLGESNTSTIVKPIIAGVVMGAVAMALPYVLFPGEVQSEELMTSWTTWTAIALLATGLLKATITPMCLNMGWVGGNFFPSIFAGVAAGYGLAAITGTDPMLMVTVTTTAFLAGVVRKPLLVLAILFLCFPAEGLLWMGLAAIIGAALPIPRILLAPQQTN